MARHREWCGLLRGVARGASALVTRVPPHASQRAVPLERLWHERYTLREAMLPSFVSKALAGKARPLPFPAVLPPSHPANMDVPLTVLPALARPPRRQHTPNPKRERTALPSRPPMSQVLLVGKAINFIRLGCHDA